MARKHARNAGFDGGNHWNTCQRCGFDIRNSESLREWTDLVVCKDCWEPRHEQDFVYAVAESGVPDGISTSSPAVTYIVVGSGLRFNYLTNSMYIALI